jgi:transposase
MTDEEMRLTRLVADQGAQIARLTNNERVHKLVLEQIKHDLKQERAAVVAYLRAPGTSCDNEVLAESIERGVHREPEEYAIGYNVWGEKK